MEYALRIDPWTHLKRSGAGPLPPRRQCLGSTPPRRRSEPPRRRRRLVQRPTARDDSPLTRAQGGRALEPFYTGRSPLSPESVPVVQWGSLQARRYLGEGEFCSVSAALLDGAKAGRPRSNGAAASLAGLASATTLGAAPSADRPQSTEGARR